MICNIRYTLTKQCTVHGLAQIGKLLALQFAICYADAHALCFTTAGDTSSREGIALIPEHAGTFMSYAVALQVL